MLVILGMDLESRCNYFSTLQGLVVVKLLTDLLYLDPSSSGRGSIGKTWNLEDEGGASGYWTQLFGRIIDTYFPPYVLYVSLVLFTGALAAVDDIVYVFMLPERVTVHFDLFNGGIIVGKVLRVLLSLYFNGFLLYENWIDTLTKEIGELLGSTQLAGGLIRE
uniref:Uncharacterized protein n=1 Tax=Strombidium rassoulzadegani TaxID=1082188 RepID=A0A7S3CQ92_9SPIT|mmetsp:Transcript_17924/g.30488  ORF Transcript_17924/g.30488 Transcript_17924/m.30488 type:complete len:163 (+) Transcript_17924:337-825(+)